jgi:hypothetical protein
MGASWPASPCAASFDEASIGGPPYAATPHDVVATTVAAAPSMTMRATRGTTTGAAGATRSPQKGQTLSRTWREQAGQTDKLIPED